MTTLTLIIIILLAIPLLVGLLMELTTPKCPKCKTKMIPWNYYKDYCGNPDCGEVKERE